MTLRVLDEDKFSDDFIGRIVIDLSAVPVSNNPEPTWHDALTSAGEIAGSLLLQVSWQEAGHVIHGRVAKDSDVSMSFSDRLRGLVSQKKIRFVQDGFNLDLTYITERIIAMGFPSESIEAVYRNPLSEVQKFFDNYHKDHFKIYNLCSERAYDHAKFNHNCARFPFDDHNAPAFRLILDICEDMRNFLNQHPLNVIAVHCKAGKGRTGLIIASFLVFSGVCKTAAEALSLFGDRRTENGKGVTIPSQKRFVGYFEQFLEKYYHPQIEFPWAGPAKILKSVRMHTMPNFDLGGGCDPYIKILLPNGKCIFNGKKVHGTEHYKKEVSVEIKCGAVVKGDFKVMFYDYDKVGRDEKMCWSWFNTNFISGNYIQSDKGQVDGAVKDTKNSKFDANFALEYFFEDASDSQLLEQDNSDVEEEEVEADE